jgi:hypothetical protein
MRPIFFRQAPIFRVASAVPVQVKAAVAAAVNQHAVPAARLPRSASMRCHRR